jgi:hypothetical protein
MYDLEFRLRGKKNIASKMCEFLPDKTNKQIRDKRNEKTYKEHVTYLLSVNSSSSSVAIEQTDRNNTTENEPPLQAGVDLEQTERDNLTINEPLQQMERELMGIQTPPLHSDHAQTTLEINAPDNVHPAIPQIVITDCNPTPPEHVSLWRKDLLQKAMEANVDKSKISKETNTILDMLGTAMQYAIEINGQVPTQHTDHIYEQVVLHIKDTNGNSIEPKASGKRERKKGKGRKARKQYIYARTQDLFQNNPGKLAKCVRDNVTWYDEGNSDLNQEDIKSHFRDIWGTKIDIRDALSGEPTNEEHT